MTLPVAILAGGVATRLRPITETIPKSLVEVAGRPFVFHQLEWLRKEGVERVVLCVGHLGEKIHTAVGDGAAFGLAVGYSLDGERLLGTGGALRKAVSKLGKEFFVLYGDSYLRCSLTDVERAFRTAGKPALMTVLKNEGRWDRSNVDLGKGGRVSYDKHNPAPGMRHIDYGLSVMRADVLARYGENEVFDLADVLAGLSARNELAGFEVTDRFYEIGSPAGLKETEEFLLKTGKR
jgi:NDP-sugar pyrophosphorylase family protein